MYTLTPEIEKTILIEDTNRYGHKRREYQARRLKIIKAMYSEWGCETFPDLLRKMYEAPMSTHEIAEKIKEVSGESMTARSVERNLKKTGKIRDIKTAFNIAIKKGRVFWQYETMGKRPRKRVGLKLRTEILTRDKHRCVLCGAGSTEDVLEVDHIVPICKGGGNEPGNLRVSCHSCNMGKAFAEKEHVVGGKLVSGRN